MTSIDNVQQIVAVIRQQLSKVASNDKRAPGRGSVRSGTDSHAARPDVFTLVGQRVKAIDPDDPQRGRKAFRVFLESVLIAELDESLINDPQFYRVVDDVQRQMEADPQVAASIDAAIRHLIAREP